MDALYIRNAEPDDLEALMAIQIEAYEAGLVEPAAVFAQRLAAAGDSIWVAELAAPVEPGLPAGAPAGYLFTYRSAYGKITPLGGAFPRSPAECLYIHDLAVRPSCAGHGIARRLVLTALDFAAQNDLDCAALVAVQSSVPFWTRFGFAEQDIAKEESARLAAYGRGARYMGRRVIGTRL